MAKARKTLFELEPGVEATIVGLNGGRGFMRRLGTRGIQVGRRIRVITRQFGGPLVVEVGNFQMTMGRGMARKVIVEVVR